jgi:alpha-mannosidase II
MPLKSNETDQSMIQLKTGTDYDAYFSKTTGNLMKYASASQTILSGIKFVKYETHKGGAYLFLPDGPAQDVESYTKSWIRVEHGPLRSRVCVNMQPIMHCVEIYPTLNKAKGFKIPLVSVWNVVDLRNSNNYELAMLVQTDIKSDRIVYTDLNGFQYIKRKRHDKLTLQGNVFPMPAGAFIQDSKLRFSMLNSQAAGVASLADSQIQVFLDRRMQQDDGLGMSQAMNDNVVVSSRLLLFFEQVNPSKSGNVNSDFPSLLSTWLSNDLLYHIVKLKLNQENTALLQDRHFALKNSPCDLHLLNLRTMQQGVNEEPSKNEVGLILHRVSYDDCASGSFIQIPEYISSECSNREAARSYSFADFFSFLSKENMDKLEIKSTLLTLAKNHSYSLISKSDQLLSRVQPMQIEAFRVNF